MRFLVVFVAVLGYASANAIGRWGYGLTSGDVQAAVINANVAARDQARTIHEGQARAAEAVIQYNTEAARSVAETNRNLQQSAYWGAVAANQNAVAVAQNQAAAWQGVGAALTTPLVGAPYGIGLASPYGLGIRAW